MKADHDGPKGLVEAEWSLSGAQVTYRVSLPKGCSAQFVQSGRTNLLLNGRPFGPQQRLEPGTHEITFDMT